MVSKFLPELIDIRHKLHEMPELGLSEHKTSAFIAETLESWGYEVTRGMATTGVVASLRRGNSNRSIGFRADFDALPIPEETGLPYASKHPGLMHACGHDGHTAMLLGAARVLADEADFNGTVHFFFQPAEENFGGGEMMVKEGLFERFPCEQVYALHNWPGIPLGKFASRVGPIAAAVDTVTVTVVGRGGHGSEPEVTIDPIVAAASTVMAMQTLVSRSFSPHKAAVVTIGTFHAGTASNIIPDTAVFEVSIRTIDPTMRKQACDRVEQIARAQAESFGAGVIFEWQVGYPATVNHPEPVETVRDIVTREYGAEAYIDLPTPSMGSEDFSFMLNKVPGAYVLIGNGDSSGLHTAKYDFNDEAIEPGVTFFCGLARSLLV